MRKLFICTHNTPNECIQCKRSADEVVQCKRCAKWFCCVCQDISDGMYEALFEFTKLHWFCNGCEPDAIATLQASIEAGSSEVSPQLSCFDNKFSDLMSNAVQQLTKVIVEATEQFKKSLNDITRLTQQMDTLEDGSGIQ